MATSPIVELRQARQNLYEAVVTLPVDILEPLPGKTNDSSTDAAVDAYVAKWRDWHNNAVAMFNAAVMASMNSIDGTERGPHLWHFIGKPEFGDKDFAEGPWDTDFALQHMASFENRCKRENARIAGLAVRDDQARRLGLDLRRRALDLADWLRVAIERMETAFLPRVEIGAEVRPGVHSLKVTLAGYPAPGAATEIQASIARDLMRFHAGKGKPVTIDNGDAQAGKIRSLIPQLNADTGRLVRHGDNSYHVHKDMIGRIEGPKL